MALTDLTTEQLRTMRDYLPSLSDRTPGFDLAAQVQAMIDEHQALQVVTGSPTATGATVALTFTSVPVGARIVATMGTTDGTGATTNVLSAVRTDATTVTVTFNAAAGSGKTPSTVTCMVDAR